jgi:hypothetical protein
MPLVAVGLSSLLLCYGPAAALMLVALVMEQRRYAPNGTEPHRNIVRRTLLGGLIAAIPCWLLLHTIGIPFGNETHWLLPLLLTPWAFALGEALALLTRPKSTKLDGMDG